MWLRAVRVGIQSGPNEYAANIDGKSLFARTATWHRFGAISVHRKDPRLASHGIWLLIQPKSAAATTVAAGFFHQMPLRYSRQKRYVYLRTASLPDGARFGPRAHANFYWNDGDLYGTNKLVKITEWLKYSHHGFSEGGLLCGDYQLQLCSHPACY